MLPKIENAESGYHFGPERVMMDQAKGMCTFSKQVFPDQPQFLGF